MIIPSLVAGMACALIGRRYLLVGAHPVSAFRQVLDRIAAEEALPSAEDDADREGQA